MNEILKNGTIFYYTPDADIVSRYENGLSFPTIVAIVASHDRISKTAAKRRVITAILNYQLPLTPTSGYKQSPPEVRNPFHLPQGLPL